MRVKDNIFSRTLRRSADILFVSTLLDNVWSDRLKGKAICLCYHRVDDSSEWGFLEQAGLPVISPKNLQQDIHILKNLGFRFITFKDWKKEGHLDPSRPSVILSFDDGYKDQYARALPVLEQEGIKGVFFQTTGMVRPSGLLRQHFVMISDKLRKNSSDSIEQKMADYLYPNKSEIRSAHDKGHEIACHGHLHLKRSALSELKFEKDLIQSMDWLCACIGEAPSTYAFPHGEYYPEDLAIVSKYFSHAATVEPGIITSQSDPFRLPRYYWGKPYKNRARQKRWLLTGVA